MSDVAAKLLVVDDDERLRTSLCELFVEFGYSVRIAEDGFSALAAIRQQVPDVIVCDLNMPGMSGFELLSVVRRRFPAILVIAMSGSFSGSGIPPGVAADAFYEKGTHPCSLLGTVEAMAQSRRPSSHQGSSDLAAIWIPRNGQDPGGEPYVLLTCTECLRAFPHVPGSGDAVIRETECVFCASRIHYAMVQPLNPASPQAFSRRPGTGAPSPLCVPNLSL